MKSEDIIRVLGGSLTHDGESWVLVVAEHSWAWPSLETTCDEAAFSALELARAYWEGYMTSAKKD